MRVVKTVVIFLENFLFFLVQKHIFKQSSIVVQLQQVQWKNMYPKDSFIRVYRSLSQFTGNKLLVINLDKPR